MLYLTEEEVAELLSMDEALEVVERALRGFGEGWIVNNARRGLRMPKSLLMSLEAGDASSGFLGHKNYIAVPGHGVLSHFFLYDSQDRVLLAMMRANQLGRIRTGATSGVAAKYLARREASRYASFGAGFQAETQLEAISRVRPIREVRVWSRRRDHADAFCARFKDRFCRISFDTAVDNPEDLAAWADIITVATRSSEPVVFGAWLSPGAFVNAIGSNAVGRAEVDVDVVVKADLIVVDSLEGAKTESGDLLPAAESGQLLWGRVIELGSVVAGLRAGRSSDEQIVLFESQGLGLEDLAVGTLVYKKAIETGIGQTYNIE